MTLTRHRLIKILDEPAQEELYLEDLQLEEEDEPTQKLVSVAQGKQKKSSWLKLALRIGVTILLFGFLAKSVSWSTLTTTLLHVRYSTFLLGLTAGCMCVVFSTYGWHSLVLAERIRMDLARLIDLYLVGIAFSHFLPTSMGGDAIKAFYVGADSGNMAGSASAALLTRITSFVGMLLIALPAVAIMRNHLDGKLVLWFVLLCLLLVCGIVGAFLLAVFLPTISSKFLKGKWTKNKIVETILKVGMAMSAASKRPKSMLVATLFGMMFWVVSFLNYFGYSEALGMHVPLSFYLIAIPFVSIIAALPISINGFGVRESAFVYIFSTIHIPAASSLLLALLMDAQVLFFGIIGGCIYLTMGFKKAQTNGVNNG